MTESEITNTEIKNESIETDIVSNQNFNIVLRHNNHMQNGMSSTPIWLITFTDVIALMLTFFVLLYAMSNPEIEKWENKIGTPLHNSASYSGPKNNAGTQEGINLNRIDFQTAENMAYLQGLFDDFILNNTDNQKISIQLDNDRITLNFPLNSVENYILKPDLLLSLKQLTPLLKSLDNKIALSTYKKDKNSILILQKIGQEIGKNGYDKDIALQIHGDKKSSEQISIVIEAHNGRRITR